MKKTEKTMDIDNEIVKRLTNFLRDHDEPRELTIANLQIKYGMDLIAALEHLNMARTKILNSQYKFLLTIDEQKRADELGKGYMEMYKSIHIHWYNRHTWKR